MGKHYSPSLNGFFDDDIHGERMPTDIVGLPDEEYHALLQAQSAGRRIVAGAHGRPVAIERVPTPEELAATRLRQRDQALASMDGIVARHRDEIDLAIPTTLTREQYATLLQWRAALRAMPQAPDWPNAPIPERPDIPHG